MISENHITATQINHRETAKKLTLRFLEGEPLRQAEAIANHYIAHAEVALQIKRILLYSLQSNCENSERLIDMLVTQIKTDHLYDLGIELEWKKEK